MQRLKMMILAATAVCALGVTMAASAYAGVEMLNAKGEPTTSTFSGSSTKKVTYSTLGNTSEVLCAKTTTEGKLETGGKLGTFHIALEGCDTSIGGTCTGLGDASGTVLALGGLHLATNTALTVGYVLFLTEHFHLSCTVLGITKLYLVLGELLCSVTPINAFTTKLTITCKKGAERGDPETTSYVNDAGKAATLTNALQSSEGDTAETMAAEEGGFEVTITPEVKLDV